MSIGEGGSGAASATTSVSVVLIGEVSGEGGDQGSISGIKDATVVGLVISDIESISVSDPRATDRGFIEVELDGARHDIDDVVDSACDGIGVGSVFEDFKGISQVREGDA